MNIKTCPSRGSILITLVVILPVLLGIVGLLVDSGNVYMTRRTMQSAADAAAISGAFEAQRGLTTNITSAAQSDAALNGYPTTEATVDVYSPPSSGTHAGQTGYVEVIIHKTISTYLMGMLGIGEANVSARAVAGIKAGLADCMITPSFFSINGTNTATLNNCSAAIGGNLSATNQAGITITGTGSITVYDNATANCNSCSPTPIKTTATIPPLPTLSIPAGLGNGTGPTCVGNNCTFTPGIFNALVSLSSSKTYTFGTGFYVFNQGFKTNGATTKSGTGGTTFYIGAAKPLDLSGTVTLTAPTPAGCTAGSAFAIYQAPSTTKTAVTLGGSGNLLKLTGITDLSQSDVTVNGSPNQLVISGTILSNSITLHGNMAPGVSGNACNNYTVDSTVTFFE